jgi:iron complex outermembrane receptor protein
VKNIYLLLFVFIAATLTINAQTGTIKGKITTTDGHPAPFVNITLKEINKGAITSEQGVFMLNKVKQGSYTLVVSHTGLQTLEKQVTIGADEVLAIHLALVENSKQLDAVFVDGRKSLNEKVITIGKAGIAPMDLPQSISVVPQTVLKDQQVMRLSDVVKNVNGVYLGTARGSTQETFYARGYSFSNSNMFKNGARINSGVMPEVSGLERVEVLKGSAAILYGNVSPGGILNMVTKKPKFNFGGEVNMRAGSYDLYKPSFDIYGPISSKLAYRLNGTYEKANSYRNQVHSSRYYVNPSLLYKLSNKTEIIVEGDYLYHEFTPDFGIGSLDNTKIPDVPRSTFFGTPWQYAKSQQATATVTVNHQFNDHWSLNSSASYQQYNRDYYSTERIQAKANGDWSRPLNKTKTQEDYYVAQVNLNGKFKTAGIEHHLLTGIDADRYLTSNYTYNQPTTYDIINLLDPAKYTPRTDIPDASAIKVVKAPINRFGAYVQDLISLTSKLKVLAGVRWSYQESRPATTTDLLTHVETKTTIRTDKAFSPRFGVVYKPLTTTSVFASYANSFVINNSAGVTDVYGNQLPPSLVDQFEIGVKNDFFRGLLSANVTLYRIKNNNLVQTAQFQKDGVTENTNPNFKALTGETTSDGVEVDLSAHPVAGLNIVAGYSYNYMRYTKTDTTKTGNFKEGERLVNTPAHTANASVFYTFTTTALKGVKVGVTALYIGDRVGGWNNTKGQAQTYDRRIPVDGFCTVDVSAGYTWKNISLLAKVSNLTNTYNYYVHENYSINPIAPRQVVATVSYKF